MTSREGTSREDLKITDVSGGWPVDDFYFRAGACALSEQLEEHAKNQSFFFINLNRHTLRAFISEFTGITPNNIIEFTEIVHNNIIIICSRRLLPLAHFWLKESRCVRAVFDSDMSVERVMMSLNKLQPDHEVMLPVCRRPLRLTHQDLLFLRSYIEQSNVLSLQLKLACSCSTIYRWKMMIARKFGVRKMEHIFSHC